MSFWSRNKNKKDNPGSSTTPTEGQRPPQSSSSASQNSPVVPNPLTANGVGGTASPSPYSTTSRVASVNAHRPSPGSPPDSPSTITVQRSGTSGAASGSGAAWAIRKFRSLNPFPRFGHAANSTAGKEGEIYVFGGLVKEKRKNDLYVIDSGVFLSPEEIGVSDVV